VDFEIDTLKLIHQGFQPSEIYALGYHELKFFSECHDVIQKAITPTVKNPKR